MRRPGGALSVVLSLLASAPLAAQQPRAAADSAHMLDSLAGASAREETPAGYRRAVALWLEAVPLAEQAGRLRFAASMLSAAGDVSWRAGDRRRALELLPQAIERYLTAGDTLGATENSNYLGFCQYNLHQLEDAQASFRLGLRLAQALRNGAQTARALYHLALIEAAQGNPDSVPALTRAAQSAFEAVGDSQMVARIRYEVGLVAMKRPAAALAFLLLREQARHPEGLDSASLSGTWAYLSRLRSGPDAADSAVHDLHQAWSMLPSSASAVDRGGVLTLLGDALREAHRPQEAVQALEEASRLFTEAQQWAYATAARGALAEARADMGDYPGAEAILERLAADAESRGDTLVWLGVLGRQVDLLAVPLNRPTLAIEHLRRALDLARASHATAKADDIVHTFIALGPVAGVTLEVEQFLLDDSKDQVERGQLRGAAVDLYWLAPLFMLENAGGEAATKSAALGMLQLADTFAAEVHDRPLRGQVRAALAEVLIHQGMADSARMVAEQALATVQGGGGEVEGQALLALGLALKQLRQVDSALVIARRGRAVAHQSVSTVVHLATHGLAYRSLAVPRAVTKAANRWPGTAPSARGRVASPSGCTPPGRRSTRSAPPSTPASVDPPRSIFLEAR